MGGKKVGDKSVPFDGKDVRRAGNIGADDDP